MTSKKTPSKETRRGEERRGGSTMQGEADNRQEEKDGKTKGTRGS